MTEYADPWVSPLREGSDRRVIGYIVLFVDPSDGGCRRYGGVHPDRESAVESATTLQGNLHAEAQRLRDDVRRAENAYALWLPTKSSWTKHLGYIVVEETAQQREGCTHVVAHGYCGHFPDKPVRPWLVCKDRVNSGVFLGRSVVAKFKTPDAAFLAVTDAAYQEHRREIE